MTFSPLNPYFEQAVREKVMANHFTQFVGFKIDQIQPGIIEGHLPVQQHHLQQLGYIHGGVTATLCDIVSGFAAYSLTEAGKGVVTVELSTSYLNPAIGDKLYAKGYVIKAGQKLYFCEAQLWTVSASGERVETAKSTSIMAKVP